MGESRRVMRRHLLPRHRPHSHGQPPGSILPPPDAPPPALRVMAYGPDAVEELAPTELAGIEPLLERFSVVWINLDGLGDGTLLRALGERFGLHPLALEDVVNVHQRPKLEPYDDRLFLVLRMVKPASLPDEEHPERELTTEQLSLFLGEGVVLTFQETPGDCFDGLRERIRQGRGRVRKLGADYLAYTLVDSVVDHYFPVLERYGERIEELEDAVLERPRESTVREIHTLRHELLALRRILWPLRDAIGTLNREELPAIRRETQVYLRDCHDHALRIIDTLETYRELGASLLEIYLSSLNNRLSETMRVLTVFATIFIPLTFIAGLYGMNFDTHASRLNMPELRWGWGYPFALGLMAATALGLLAYFRRKGWLGGR